MLRSQNLIPLTGGAYKARSINAVDSVCENLIIELIPQEQDAPTPTLLFNREGKRPLSSPPVQGVGRGVFTTSDGALYAAVGSNFYAIGVDWNWTLLGAISNLLTPVSLSDNGVNAVAVDGTTAGYTITLGTNIFSSIDDPTGTFVGSIRADYSDTYLAFAAPNTNEIYLTLSNQINFNVLVQANKDSTPDNIVTFAFNIRQLWLIGEKGTEIWYLAGSTPFPYQEWPNIFVPYGCASPYSLVQADIDLYWISQNEQGQAIAVKTHGYTVEAISTRALEYLWSTYPTVSDCIGSTFQQSGHTYIIFNFPTADATLAYDLSTKQWHKRTYCDHNGVLHREKTSFYASVGPNGGYPKTIVGQDWATGQLYALDPEYYTDNGMPIIFKKTFPHQIMDMKEITHVSFVADFETGQIPNTEETPVFTFGSAWSNGFSNAFGPVVSGFNQNLGPALCMRYSNDGGNTWSNYRQKNLVGSGYYRSMMRWRGLGMARDRIYELLWAFPGKSALQGAYLEPLPHST